VTAASGETFVASIFFRAKLVDENRAEVVDMNFFGLLATCADHSVPLATFREFAAT
jgi:nucleoside phosphorylase